MEDSNKYFVLTKDIHVKSGMFSISSDTCVRGTLLIKKSAGFLGSSDKYKVATQDKEISLKNEDVYAVSEEIFRILLALLSNKERHEELLNNRETSRLDVAEKVLAGSKVSVKLEKNGFENGTLMYKGPIKDKGGTYFGIQLEKAFGDNNGAPHFTCAENHAVFVPLNKLTFTDFMEKKEVHVEQNLYQSIPSHVIDPKYYHEQAEKERQNEDYLKSYKRNYKNHVTNNEFERTHEHGNNYDHLYVKDDDLFFNNLDHPAATDPKGLSKQPVVNFVDSIYSSVKSNKSHVGSHVYSYDNSVAFAPGAALDRGNPVLSHQAPQGADPVASHGDPLSSHRNSVGSRGYSVAHHGDSGASHIYPQYGHPLQASKPSDIGEDGHNRLSRNKWQTVPAGSQFVNHQAALNNMDVRKRPSAPMENEYSSDNPPRSMEIPEVLETDQFKDDDLFGGGSDDTKPEDATHTGGQLEEGSHVKLHLDMNNTVCNGVIRWKGRTEFSENTIGVELEKPKGKSDGIFMGSRKFQCKEYYGIFVKPEQCELYNKTLDEFGLRVGSLVKLQMNAQKPSYGVVRWLGPTHLHEQTAGIELEELDGNSDGSFNGNRYFHCRPQKAVFVQASFCEPDDRGKQTLSPAGSLAGNQGKRSARDWHGNGRGRGRGGATHAQHDDTDEDFSKSYGAAGGANRGKRGARGRRGDGRGRGRGGATHAQHDHTDEDFSKSYDMRAAGGANRGKRGSRDWHGNGRGRGRGGATHAQHDDTDEDFSKSYDKRAAGGANRGKRGARGWRGDGRGRGRGGATHAQHDDTDEDFSKSYDKHAPVKSVKKVLPSQNNNAYCTTCQLKMTSTKQLLQHQQGRTHKSKEAALLNEIDVGSVLKLLNLKKQSPREASYGENTVGVELGQLNEQTQQLKDYQSQLKEQNHQLQDSQSQLNERTQQLQEKTTEIDNLITSHILLPRRQLDESRNHWLIDRAELELSEETIGRGAWGSVTKAKFRGTKVSVKKIHDLIVSPHTQGLFAREMSMASRCRHPCLVQFIGATIDRTPLFVMELMQTDLRSQLGREALSEENYLNIGHDVSQALAYLHLSKPTPILHRDISSANVLLYEAGGLWRGKLSDYGSANFMRQATTNNPGAVLYSAPESGGTTQTTKLDVYSFGVLFCEMIINDLPKPDKRIDQLYRIQNSDYRGLVARCISNDIDKRPSTPQIVEQFEGWKTPFL